MELEEGGTAEDDGEQEELVPTVFRWEHGGRQVYITGTFNNWEKQLPMHRSGNDFTYIHNLTKGKHAAYKFIVDDEWRFAPDQPTVADVEGRVNNFIDVAAFRPPTGRRTRTRSSRPWGKAEEEYSQWMPDLEQVHQGAAAPSAAPRPHHPQQAGGGGGRAGPGGAAPAAARGPEPPLLHGHQGRDDGPRHDPTVQVKVCDNSVLQHYA
ncbi:unnamed protein product, partial [Heterosigma akashiwo]